MKTVFVLVDYVQPLVKVFAKRKIAEQFMKMSTRERYHNYKTNELGCEYTDGISSIYLYEEKIEG